MSSSIAFATIAEARRFDRSDLEAAAQLVDDKRRQRFPFDVLRDDQQRLARLHDRFEDWQHRLQIAELLLVEEDVGILQLRTHLVGIGDEIRGQIATIELHALNDVEFGLSGLSLLDGDHTFIADLFHRLGDYVADGGVAIGGDGGDLGDLVRQLEV